ncbi:MAG: hypothetical protein KJ757_01530 [Planctomycetes bacterium]|nr:hypothetical protein [Planctomycetota bacterium]MBU1517908.1 hypothetical protein [Planctomycetota bacterium]MBU2457383.1 hypothetical protein [Planctomycetota bacterium]MBU2596232.1 hypothetical protein [Planctomycetota bacterium]
MNMLFVLAEAESNQVMPIDVLWEQIARLSWLEALIAVSFGAVYLIYGWRIFKVLAVVSFGMVGLFAGMQLGEKIGGSNSILWGGVIGLALLSVLSVPLMHWAVSALGAVAGGIITSCIWYAVGLPPEYIWAGAIIGIVAGGMISFIVFRISVMLFTSLGGAILIITGLLALANIYEQSQTESGNFVYSLVNDYNWFMPAMLIFATFVGMVVQNKLVKGASNWKL